MPTIPRFTAPRRALVVGAMALAVGVGGLGVAGCGLSPKPTASPSPSAPVAASPSTADGLPDVCQLFTTAEIVTLTQNTKVTGSKANTDSKPGAPSCDWLATDGAIVVNIALKTTTKAAFDADAPNYTAVSGVGDGAYENHGILTALHGTTEISVIFGGSGEESVAVAKAVAIKVIEKLDGPSASPSAS